MKTFRIGRVPDNNDLVLPSPVISSQHAEIVIDDYNRMTFTDHSTNGTYINNRLLNHSSCEVSVNDKIVFPDGSVLDWGLVLGPAASYNPAGMGAPGMGMPSSGMGYPSMGTQGFGAPGMGSPGMGAPGYAMPETGGNVPSEGFRLLNFSQTFGEAFRFGGKNILSVIGIYLLWLLTCWIPYINVGTTIALTLLPLKMAEGTAINPLYIFESKYRKCMGEFLLTMVLKSIGIAAAGLFLFFPATVLSLSWSLALYYLLDARMNPTEALHASNEATYGSKWTLFFVRVVFGLIFGFVIGLFSTLVGILFLSSTAGAIIGILLLIVLIACIAAITNGISASVWLQLRDNVARR